MPANRGSTVVKERINDGLTHYLEAGEGSRREFVVEPGEKVRKVGKRAFMLHQVMDHNLSQMMKFVHSPNAMTLRTRVNFREIAVLQLSR